jgi:hypothetical protein
LGSRDEQTRDKFLSGPKQTAMLRAMFPQAEFIACKQSVTVPVKIQSKISHSEIEALLDSGATQNFISPRAIRKHGIPTRPLETVKQIRNADGTRNKIGEVTSAADLRVHHQGETHMHPFYVIDLGKDDMLLGMPFLSTANPKIDWVNSSMDGTVVAAATDAEKWDIISSA